MCVFSIAATIVSMLKFILKPSTFTIVVFAFALLSSPVSAQVGRYIFDHLTVDDGLSQSTVFAITKDADGFMWFGTRDGLNRYDSRTIKVYRNKPNDPTSLSGNGIQCFFTDNDKKLWIGTSEGISIYNPVLDNFIQSKLDPYINERLSNNHVTAIASDKDGEIWVATHGGLNKVTSKEPLRYQRFVHDQDDEFSLINNEIRALYRDKSGELWIGTAVGVSRLIKSKDGSVHFKNYPLPSRQLKGLSWINCLSENEQGDLIIGTEDNGVKILHKNSGAITALKLDHLAGRPVESVRVIQRSGSHEFWLGTIDGLFIYNDEINSITAVRNSPDDNTTLADNSVRSIFIDPAGTYWVGTFYGGANSYSPASRQFGEVTLTNQKNQKAYKVAGAMVTDKKANLWIGTDGNGLYCLNPAGETIDQYKHNRNDASSLSHNKVKSLLLDDDGLWIGTMGGLNYLNFSTGKIKRFFNEPGNERSISDDRIYDIKKDSENNIWIATYRGGLCLFNNKTQDFQRFMHDPENENSISSDGVTYIHEDSQHNLWVGTISGLNKKPQGKIVFEHHGNHVGNNSNGGDYILCIYEDTYKNLWVGTRDTGLKVKLNGSRDYKQFTWEDGLPGNNISGIQEDGNGNLWISTDNGLARLNLKTMAFKTYNKSDGLACKEFNFNSFHKDNRGNLYFGGYNGIIKFHPDSIRENPVTPKVVFSKLKLFNREVAIEPAGKGVLSRNLSRTTELTFNYQQNVFSVEFAGLSFINPVKNRYAYKLEGFEDQWNFVDDPVATYMNLQPGTYTLLAKASNNDGYWTTEPVRLQIQILPPPWKTWWAYSIYTCIILGLVFALIRFNKMRWKLTHDLEIEHMEKEQQEKLHHAKLNFFTNVAHEIRTPLTLIVSPLELIEKQHSQDPLLLRQLRMIKSNTTRLMQLINQLLDFQKQEAGNLRLKMQRGDVVELLKDVVFSFTEHARARHVLLNLDADTSKIEFAFDRDELEKVFCNLLHNAFKFTPAGGAISVSVGKVDLATTDANVAPSLRVVIEDNGIGIPSEDLPKIFNRFFQVEHSNINESGFGIGLALAKGIIQLHGGSINVESREADVTRPGFTRFTILLPLTPLPGYTSEETPALARDGSDENELLQTDETDGSDARHNKPMIMLVEDNVEIRTCLKEILSPSYEILEANHGKEAWPVIAEQLPDLIVSDIAMSEMDGLELTRLVKNDERTNHIPVILLTARSTTEHHVEGIGIGADDYITKPFHAQILLLKIRNLIASREKLKEKYHRVVTLEPVHEEVEDPENKFLTKLKNILEANLTDPDFNVTKLVTEIGMSRPVLFRKIKMLTGLSVIDLIRSTRLKKAEMLLKQKRMTISEVAFTVGFNDPKYFSKSFRSQFGKTPTEYIESLKH